MIASLTPPTDADLAGVDTPPLRVLVVDDSLIYRKVVRDTLATIPGVEVVASAANGAIAVDKIQQLKPDLVTLDFEMPELDGPGVLAWMKKNRVATKAVMISALTSEGGVFHAASPGSGCVRLRRQAFRKRYHPQPGRTALGIGREGRGGSLADSSSTGTHRSTEHVVKRGSRRRSPVNARQADAGATR